MTFREVRQAAKAAGPWTAKDDEAIAMLREISRSQGGLTDAEQNALRVLRLRETKEAIRLRKLAAVREP